MENASENGKKPETARTGRIHVLEKQVAELIAAGEVVERPASAVKELLENAIDAGATVVTLEIKNGGVAFIRVTDNGCGILREDVPTAFLRHATSKVLTAEDLASVGTLGFRGEALASICAVSRVELLTRTAGEVAGTRARLEGGEPEELEDAGCPEGTTIVVRDLFYNTPARMKFLKKDVTEGNAVAAVAQGIALSHPEVSIRFIKDGRDELHTPGDGKLLSAVRAVLGREFASALLPVDYRLGHAAVSGFAAKPLAARRNRNMEYFFLNGRLVKSRTMMAALEEAYKNNIMAGKYPGCVLHLALDASLADVNVHPAKLEVRFANEHDVFDAVYYAVKNALEADTSRPELNPGGRAGLAWVMPDARPAPAGSAAGQAPPPAPAAGTAPEEPAFEAAAQAAAARAPLDDAEARQLRLMLRATPLQPEQEDTSILRSTAAAAYTPVANGNVEIAADDLPAPEAPEPQPFTSEADAPGETPAPAADVGISAAEPEPLPVRVVGECFGTYILAQMGKGLWVIDKHAAHERILYETIRKQREAAAQLLLQPVVVALPAAEYAAALENLDLLRGAGVAAEDFGGSSLLVREAPLDLVGQDIPALVSELAGLLLTHRKELVPARLDWLFHSVACRAAVKARDYTTPQEMLSLAERVLQNDDIRYCPHGRPVAFEIPLSELERKFGRG